MSVAGQVGEHGVGSAKRPLSIDDPFELSQGGEVGFEGCWLGQHGPISVELQAPGLVGRGQPLQEQAAEEAGEHADGQEETGSASNPVLAIEREAAAGYDDVGMRMVRQALGENPVSEPFVS